jgi:hypothetical protein
MVDRSLQAPGSGPDGLCDLVLGAVASRWLFVHLRDQALPARHDLALTKPTRQHPRHEHPPHGHPPHGHPRHGHPRHGHPRRQHPQYEHQPEKNPSCLFEGAADRRRRDEGGPRVCVPAPDGPREASRRVGQPARATSTSTGTLVEVGSTSWVASDHLPWLNCLACCGSLRQEAPTKETRHRPRPLSDPLRDVAAVAGVEVTGAGVDR